MARRRSTGDRLADALARAKPRKVRVSVGDETHEVKCDGARVRWTAVAETLREIADGDTTSRATMIDAEGATLGVVRVLDADENENVGAPTNGAMDARDERLLTLLVSAQRAALDEQRQLLTPVLESYTALARGYAEYAAQVVELVRLAASVKEEMASSSSAADAALASLAAKVVGAPNIGAQTK
jgi:ABC-type transporter Mla subunit MlaD